MPSHNATITFNLADSAETRLYEKVKAFMTSANVSVETELADFFAAFANTPFSDTNPMLAALHKLAKRSSDPWTTKDWVAASRQSAGAAVAYLGVIGRVAKRMNFCPWVRIGPGLYRFTTPEIKAAVADEATWKRLLER